jgi:hypothetical protein
MIKLASIVLSGFAITVTVAPALADSMLFGEFTQSTPSQDFVLTSNLLNAATGASSITITGGGDISFDYLIGGTPFSLSATPAKLTFTATSIVTGHCVGFPNCLSSNAPFTELGYSGSFAITADTPISGLSNLLSGTFNLLAPGDALSGAQLTSAVDALTGSLEATTTSSHPNQVVFTSDFLKFAANTLNRDATFNLSSLTPMFSSTSNTNFDNRFPNSFTAMGSGSFSDALVEIPEPSTLGLLASALLGGLCLWQRKRRLLRR